MMVLQHSSVGKLLQWHIIMIILCSMPMQGLHHWVMFNSLHSCLVVCIVLWYKCVTVLLEY